MIKAKNGGTPRSILMRWDRFHLVFYDWSHCSLWKVAYVFNVQIHTLFLYLYSSSYCYSPDKIPFVFFWLVDIDECSQSIGNMCAFQCVNIQGSYQCACPSHGYSMSPNGRTCQGKSHFWLFMTFGLIPLMKCKRITQTRYTDYEKFFKTSLHTRLPKRLPSVWRSFAYLSKNENEMRLIFYRWQRKHIVCMCYYFTENV